MLLVLRYNSRAELEGVKRSDECSIPRAHSSSGCSPWALRQILAGAFVGCEADRELASNAGTQFDSGGGASDPTVRAGGLQSVLHSGQGVEFGNLAVAIDDPDLCHANASIKLQLFVGLVARAANLDNNVRTAFEVFIAVDSKTLGRQQDKIRNAVIVRPAAGRSHINPVVDACAAGRRPIHAEIIFESEFEILMFAVRHWRHMQHTVPNLIPSVRACALAPLQ